MRRIAEQLAESLFTDTSLRAKHRKYLDLLQFGPKLGRQAKFTPAKRDALNTGVRRKDGTDASTPHNFFVDDDIYSDIFAVERNEQAVASSIESVFILLGKPDLASRQDPISWEKMSEMLINFRNKVLGQIINTRTMTVTTPRDYISDVARDLRSNWCHRKSFSIRKILHLVGRLNHIGGTAPWICFLLSHVYTSITAALKVNTAHLIQTNKEFRDMIKRLKGLTH